MNKFAGMTDEEIADAVVARLRGDFLDSAGSRVIVMEDVLAAGRLSGKVGPDDMASLRKAVHNLKGMGTTFGFPLISDVALRFETCLKLCPNLGMNQIVASKEYVDTIKELLALAEMPSEIEAAKILERLPSRLPD